MKKRIIVDGIDFSQVFRVQLIFRAITGAMQLPRLMLALFMVVLLIAGGRLWDTIAGKSVSPLGLAAGRWTAPEELGSARAAMDSQFQELRDAFRKEREAMRARGAGSLELQRLEKEYLVVAEQAELMMPKGAFEASASHIGSCFERVLTGVAELNPPKVYGGVGDLFVTMPTALWKHQRMFLFVYGFFVLVIFSQTGGAICRMAACQLAAEERLRMRDAVDFSLSTWPSLLLAPLLPLIIAAALSAVVIVLGLGMLVPVLDIVAALIYGLALFFGFFLAFVMIGYGAGFSLLLPAVAVENGGAGDAMQRAYAYVIHRPIHLLCYIVVALVGLVLGYLIVALALTMMLNFTAALFGLFSGNSAMAVAGGFGVFDLGRSTAGVVHDSWHSSWAANIIRFWQGVVVCVVVAYVVAYLFSASTIIYLLMRRACDGQDLEEIWRPGQTPGTMAASPGLATVAEPVFTGSDEPAKGGDDEEDSDGDR